MTDSPVCPVCEQPIQLDESVYAWHDTISRWNISRVTSAGWTPLRRPKRRQTRPTGQ